MEQKQKLSIEAMPINSNQNKQKTEQYDNKHTFYKLSETNSPHKSNLIDISKAQQLLSASVFFPKNNSIQN